MLVRLTAAGAIVRPARLGLATIGAAAMLLSGCGAGWRNMPVTNQGSLTPRQETQVWVHGVGAFQLHDLHWTPDSVFGKTYLAELEGDTTIVGIPRSRVDSIRTGNPSSGAMKSIGLGLLIMFGAAVALGIAACGTEGGCGD